MMSLLVACAELMSEAQRRIMLNLLWMAGAVILATLLKLFRIG